MITVNTYSNDDLDDLFRLFGNWDKDYVFEYTIFKESVENALKMDNKIILAKDQNEIVGYAQLSKQVHLGFETYLEIVQLLVAEDKRSKGIGKYLVEESEKIALEMGIKRIELSSQIKRSRAHVFYENNGYELQKVSKFYKKDLL
jgi:GNAT superfamily N-acetyltransferase